MKKCAVIGSINMDMVINVNHFPAPGETITGDQMKIVPGGKGANQAVALARLGVPVCMAGCMGEDEFCRRYMEHFRQNCVDVRAVETVSEASTGLANIQLDANGDNTIVVVPGANGRCDLSWLDRALEKVMDCDIFLLQLEIPHPTVEACIRRLHAAGKTVILDPAPAAVLPEDVLSQADILTPNETELKIITPDLPEEAGVEARIHRLVGDSGRMVIHKRGGDGAYIGTRDGIVHIPGYRVQVVDTTAAGDTFNAGLAAGLAQGLSIEASVRLANAAGALAVTAFGAQDGMPSMSRVEALMEEQKEK